MTLELPSRGPEFLAEIMGDDGLTSDEQWLMIEALFVHDASAPPPAVGSAPEPVAAERRARTRRRRSREALPIEISDTTFGSGHDGTPVTQPR